MKYAFGLGLVILALILSACGVSGAQHQQAQAKGRPLPAYERAVLPAGQYYTTEFEPSLSFRIAGDDWRFEGPSTALGDPEHPDYLFVETSDLDAEIAFFNLRKLQGIQKPRGPAGETEPVPAPDELFGWFRRHPYLETSKLEPVTVGGVKGVQFDVVTDLPKLSDKTGVDTFKLSTGGFAGIYYLKKERFIVLKDVKGVPVVIQYGQEKDEIDEFVPMAKKVLKSIEWTGS